MNTTQCKSLTALAGLLTLLVCGTAPAQTANRYKPEECGRCHRQHVYDIEVGIAHKGIPCAGCHEGHSPDKQRSTAPCDTCHSRKKNAHFEIEVTRCLNCHTNPHKPSLISLKGETKDVCLACHWAETRQLMQNESKHTALDCARCHDAHGKIPQCVQCHRAAHSGRIAGSCKACHQRGHMPKLAALPPAPSTDCASCHKMAEDLLSATASKHKNMACANCHEQGHSELPDCRDCHGSPHPSNIMAKFPQCGMCHHTAHDLNNWPGTATRAAARKTLRIQN